MRVLVLGAGGMAGHVIALSLKEAGHDVATLSASRRVDDDTVLIDAMDRSALLAAIDDAAASVVVNSIGVLIEESESRKDRAAYLNAFLPHLLSRHLGQSEARLIHLSTDCVFSGHSGPYREGSFRDGDTFYDRSKALGEVVNDRDLTFRMSIIGPDTTATGVGLVNWFLQQRGTVRGFSRAMWSGVTTIELARAIGAAMETELTGLYHLVPPTNISKLDLLRLIQREFEHPVEIVPDDSVAVDKTLVNTRSDFPFEVRSYDEMVTDMRRWVDDHRHLYPHYGQPS